MSEQPSPIEDTSRDVKVKRPYNRKPKRADTGKDIRAREIVAALVDRLFKTERSLETMREELKDYFEMLAEQQPKLRPGGTLSFRAMKTESDEAVEVNVVLVPSAVATIEGV